jgi:hypothetical protein
MWVNREHCAADAVRIEIFQVRVQEALGASGPEIFNNMHHVQSLGLVCRHVRESVGFRPYQ